MLILYSLVILYPLHYRDTRGTGDTVGIRKDSFCGPIPKGGPTLQAPSTKWLGVPPNAAVWGIEKAEGPKPIRLFVGLLGGVGPRV